MYSLTRHKTSGPTGGGAHMWVVCGELWNEVAGSGVSEAKRWSHCAREGG